LCLFSLVLYQKENSTSTATWCRQRHVIRMA